MAADGEHRARDGARPRRDVVDEHGERRADVLVEGGRSSSPSSPIDGRRGATRARRRRDASSRPGSSICTPTCASRAASRPRRSRPAHGRRRSAATPRSSRCRTPTPAIDSRVGRPRRARPRPRARSSRSPSPARSRSGARGEQPRPDGGDGRARRAPLHRRRPRRPGRRRSCAGRSSTPATSASCSPSTARTRRSPRGGHMHEGAWSSRLGIAGPARARRGGDGRARPRARPADRRADALPAPLDAPARSRSSRRAKARGAAGDRRGDAAPPRLTDAAVASLRPGLQGEPAASRPPPTSSAAARGPAPTGTIDAIATDHAPHPAEAKEEPFDDAPPGMLGLETALAVAYGVLVATGGSTRARRRPARARSPAVAALGSRRASPASTDGGQGGPIAAGSAGATSACSTRRDAGSSTRRAWRAGAANSPFAGDDAHRRVRHTVCRRRAGRRSTGQATSDDAHR